MKLLLKILFFVLAIFQTNIGEAKVVVFDNAVSEIALSSVFNSEKSSEEFQDVSLENDVANTVKVRDV